MTLSDAYIKFKIMFHVPLPLRNHFYKGGKISMRRNWLCKNCQMSFDLVPWKAYKDKGMSEVACPHCGSASIHWSDKLFRAQVDRKPKSVLLEIAKNPER